MTPLQAYNIGMRANRMSRADEQNQQSREEAPGVASQIGQMFLPQVFGPSGEAPTQAEREASHRGRFAQDAQAGNTMVERVNPAYPPPPGTPQQLAAIQQEIENILAARAQAERAETEMESQQQVLQSDQAPIQQAIDGADGGISAVQAHQQAVARRAQVNQEQQQRQQETGTLVSGYPSRAAGLTALTIPLEVFAGFTSLASHLPGDAGQSMAEMNQDANEIRSAFAQMSAAMVSQEEAQPGRQAKLSGDQSRIETADTEAGASAQSVNQSKQDAINLQQDNEAQLSQVRQARTEASQQGQTLDEAASTKQAQADSLAEQLQTWAQQHREARRQAVEATAQQLEAEGYVVLEKREG
jgi:DNA repair exonuclease SbcCD ATPase subunit